MEVVVMRSGAGHRSRAYSKQHESVLVDLRVGTPGDATHSLTTPERLGDVYGAALVHVCPPAYSKNQLPLNCTESRRCHSVGALYITMSGTTFFKAQ